MSLFRTSVLALSLITAAGCSQVDNSGGEPPAGEALQFTITGEASAFCESVDAVRFVDAQEDIDAWIDGCQAENEETRDQIEEAFANLAQGESLVIVSAQLGGCIGEYTISGAFLEDETLHMWMLKEDYAHGRANASCPADEGQAHALVVVEGADEALDIDLTVGRYNPDLPGSPGRIMDDSAE